MSTQEVPAVIEYCHFAIVPTCPDKYNVPEAVKHSVTEVIVLELDNDKVPPTGSMSITIVVFVVTDEQPPLTGVA